MGFLLQFFLCGLYNLTMFLCYVHHCKICKTPPPPLVIPEPAPPVLMQQQQKLRPAAPLPSHHSGPAPPHPQVCSSPSQWLGKGEWAQTPSSKREGGARPDMGGTWGSISSPAHLPLQSFLTGN